MLMVPDRYVGEFALQLLWEDSKTLIFQPTKEKAKKGRKILFLNCAEANGGYNFSLPQ